MTAKINFFKKIIPNNYRMLCYSVLPLIMAQVFQRLLFVINNHYIAILGKEALLIHNIQFSFIYAGQYIGAATGISCLIFYRRKEYEHYQQAIFNLHILLCFVVSLLCIIIAHSFSHIIMRYFSIPKDYFSIAILYFNYGLFNLVLQAMYVCIFTVAIASEKEKQTWIISTFMVFITILLNRIAIYNIFNGEHNTDNIMKPLFTITITNSVLLIMGTVALFSINKPKKNLINCIKFSHKKTIVKVWLSELACGFLTGFYPIIYILQLRLVSTKDSLIVTYQLLMQLIGIFCIPFYAVMQIAIRDASENFGSLSNGQLPEWLKKLLFFGFIPTIVLMFFYFIFPKKIFLLIYNYRVPLDQMSYVLFFLMAVIVNQIGNLLTIPTRANKNSYQVMFVYFFSDFFLLIMGMQAIIFFNKATPFTAGLIMLIYTLFYTIMSGYFAYKNVKN